LLGVWYAQLKVEPETLVQYLQDSLASYCCFL